MRAAQELKRRGMAAVDGLLERGPVHIVKNNRARYVVMRATEYDTLMDDLAEARLAASAADLKYLLPFYQVRMIEQIAGQNLGGRPNNGPVRHRAFQAGFFFPSLP